MTSTREALAAWAVVRLIGIIRCAIRAVTVVAVIDMRVTGASHPRLGCDNAADNGTRCKSADYCTKIVSVVVAVIAVTIIVSIAAASIIPAVAKIIPAIVISAITPIMAAAAAIDGTTVHPVVDPGISEGSTALSGMRITGIFSVGRRHASKGCRQG